MKVVRTLAFWLSRVASFGLAGALLSGVALSETPQAPKPSILQEVGIDQKLNEQIPLNLVFHDETGKDVLLKQYFDTRPVVLVFVYYECPMLCTLTLNGLERSLRAIPFNAGVDFDVVAVSFDPHETWTLAAAKKKQYVDEYHRPGTESGWHFLTGEEAEIEQLTSAAGFRYKFDSQTQQWAHATGILTLTPKGRISHYFYGVEYSARDLRLSLVEASNYRIGAIADQVLLYCYRYDPATGKYGFAILSMVRVAGILTVLALVVFIVGAVRREHAGAVPKKRWSSAMIGGIPFLPERASTAAVHVDHLVGFLLAVTGILAGTIFLLIFYFAIRYRRRRHTAVQIRNNLVLEIAWSVIPLGLTVIMFLWGAKLYMQNRQPPENAETMYVVGKQWMWTFEHPEGRREIDQLHVPLGKPIQLIMASQDVIHDFFVPAFRVKEDVVPGRYTMLWFEATKTGEFQFYCSQYCGTQHSAMIGSVIVMKPSDFEDWLGGGLNDSPVKAGAQLFQDFSCANCHEPGPRQRGPTLSGMFGKSVRLQDGRTVVFDEAYMQESIVAPEAKVVEGYRPIMPSFRDQLDNDEIVDLIAYVRSLSSEGAKQ